MRPFGVQGARPVGYARGRCSARRPRRGRPTPSVLVTVAVLAAGCATSYRESGYLVHEDESYEEVLSPQGLFPDAGAAGAELGAELRFRSEALDLERNYLRYRLVANGRYYTVHGPSDPTIPVPAGTHRIGIQGITVSTYVTGQRVEYATPATVEVTVAPAERVEVVLAPASGGRLEARVRRAGDTSGGAPAALLLAPFAPFVPASRTP